jgi:hypothetical protein
MIPVRDFFSYFVCGIIFAAIAGIGGFRWARLVSLAWSVPAALYAVPMFFFTLILTFGSFDGRDSAPVYWSLCPIIYLLIISMPVFWVMLCRKLSTRALTNR